MCCELVAKVLNMFKNFIQIFLQKYVARTSRDVGASVVNLPPQNCGILTMRKFHDTLTDVVRQSHNSLEKICHYLGRK